MDGEGEKITDNHLSKLQIGEYFHDIEVNLSPILTEPPLSDIIAAKKKNPI